jgi:glycosyltransferase involved in cell wall biosynthesis
MRIAFLTDEVLPGHGADTIQFVNALSALGRTGVAVDLYFPVAPNAAAVRDASARAALHDALRAHYATGCEFRLCPVPGALSGPRLLTKLAGGALATGSALRRPYDLVHTRTLLPSLAMLGARRPLFFETYRPLTAQFPAVRPVFRHLTPLRAFAGLIVHSRLVREQFVRDGVPPEKVVTLYNGFDARLLATDRDPASARAALGLSEGPTAVYAGRLGRAKACDLFIDAARRMPDVRFVFVGHDGTDDAREMKAAAQGLENVRFLGFLTGERLEQAHLAADVLLVPPSRRPLTEEGTTVMPLKLFTYLAAGRAVLAGDLPDTTELLRDGENARLVNPDDVPALVSALRGLLEAPDLRARLARGARTLAASLTWDARGERLRAFYEERLAARR